MADALLSYFEHRFSPELKLRSENGPFITISRETGCEGTSVAIGLINLLKKAGYNWKFINREVLEQAANLLKVDQSKIHYIFDAKEKKHSDEILAALSNRYYKNDKVVRKTIREVVEFYARQGNIIIVGRGGAAITENFENGLHIRLIAPSEWRQKIVAMKKNLHGEELKKYVAESDYMRNLLFEKFSDKSINSFNFDLTINCARFQKNDLIKMIYQILEIKKMI
jgi:cytidylate kinase